jgi:hypothetical protein
MPVRSKQNSSGGGDSAGAPLPYHGVSDANYSVQATDSIIGMQAITATRTITLPAAAAAGAGKEYLIKDESGSASGSVVIQIVVSGGGTMDGVAQINVTVPYGGLKVYSNGSAYFSA